MRVAIHLVTVGQIKRVASSHLTNTIGVNTHDEPIG
jgi:hypothetical protein